MNSKPWLHWNGKFFLDFFLANNSSFVVDASYP